MKNTNLDLANCICAILAMVLLCAGCSNTSSNSPPVALEEREPESAKHANVPTIMVAKSVVTQTINFPGTVAALPDHSVSIAPNIAGKISRVNVVRGQFVKRGQIIATLDEQQLLAQLAQARAPQKGAVSQLRQAKVALDLAQKNYERIDALYKKDLVAQKDVIAAQGQVEIAKAQVESDEAHIDETKIAPRQITTQLEFARVRTPISGVVADRFRNVGDATDPNTPIVHVVDLSEIIIKADMPADSTADPRVGQTATISTAAEPGVVYTGRILSISPVVNGQTNTVSVELQARNSTNRLKEGQTVTVSISTGKREAILVPKASIVPGENDPSDQFVYVVRGDKLSRTRVVLGDTVGGQIAVLEGLNGGDEIATSGMYGLPDGTILDRGRAQP